MTAALVHPAAEVDSGSSSRLLTHGVPSAQVWDAQIEFLHLPVAPVDDPHRVLEAPQGPAIDGRNQLCWRPFQLQHLVHALQDCCSDTLAILPVVKGSILQDAQIFCEVVRAPEGWELREKLAVGRRALVQELIDLSASWRSSMVIETARPPSFALTS